MAPRARLRGAKFNIAFDKLPHIYPHFADYMNIVVGPVPLIAIKIHRSMMGGCRVRRLARPTGNRLACAVVDLCI